VVGDIAVTSGPFESHVLDDKGKDRKTTGRYVTVWQRQKDGGWRFVWDGGTDD
jgi:ketosteroid isomerase-like protein